MCGTLGVIKALPPVIADAGEAGSMLPEDECPSILQAAEGQAALPVTLQEQERHDYGYDGDEGPRYHQGKERLRPSTRSRQRVPRDQADAQRVELGSAKDHERKEVVVPGCDEGQKEDGD